MECNNLKVSFANVQAQHFKDTQRWLANERSLFSSIRYLQSKLSITEAKLQKAEAALRATKAAVECCGGGKTLCVILLWDLYLRHVYIYIYIYILHLQTLLLASASSKHTTKQGYHQNPKTTRT